MALFVCIEQGYYYQVVIQEQVLFTYEQYLIEKNREKVIRTSPSDDDTNCENIN
ncbi:hypothetical protein ACT7CN_09575 [Bacillus cereus]